MAIPSLFRLDGRVAILTGGAGLLGREFARTLAEAGAHVVLADQDAGAAQAVSAGLADQGHSVLAVQTDVTRPDSVSQLAARTLEAFGSVDILVNSAALDPKFDPRHQASDTQAFEHYPLEAWNRSLAVDLTGAFLCAQAVTGPMVSQGRGTIINLCSTYGLVGPDQRLYQKPGQSPQYKPVAYSVTKAGLLGLTRYLATYLGDKGVRANALTPGGVFNDHEDEFVQAYSARAVLGRMARKDELNGALLFLASDASSYMTGANLVIDGGWTAW